MINANQPVYTTQPISYTSPVQPMTNWSVPISPSGDRLQIAYTASTPTTSIQALVGDGAIARRYSLLGINSPERLLSVGTRFGGLGTFVLNALAGNLPLFKPAHERQMIANQVNQWIGRADLMRTGMTVNDAALMQSVGVNHTGDLRRLVSPIDQGTLWTRLQAAAFNQGLFGGPDPMSVSRWISQAQTLPPLL